MLRLTINNTEVPLPANVGISLNKELFNPTEPNKTKSDYSKTIELPGTPELNKVLGHIFALDQRIMSNADAQFTPDFNPNLKAAAKLDVDGITIVKGFIRLAEITVTQLGDIVYHLTLFSPQADLFSQLRTKKMSELDFSDLNHVLNATNISNSWATSYKRGGADQAFAMGEGYVYPLIVTPDNISGSSSFWIVDFMKPALFLKEIIDKIFAGTDFEYTTDSFFDEAEFKQITVPSLDSSFEVGSAFMDDEEFLAECTTDETLSLGEILKFNNDSTGGNFDTPGTFNNATYRYETRFSGNYAFRFVGDLTLNNPSANIYSVHIGLYVDGYIKQNVIIDFPASSTTTKSLDFDFTQSCFEGNLVDLRVYAITYLSQSVPAGWTLTQESGSTFTGTITSSPLPGAGQTLNFIEFFKSSMSQLEFFAGVCKLFNLKMEVDADNPQKLRFLPFPDFYGTTVFSLEEHRDISRDTISIPMGELTAATYRFAYKAAKDPESIDVLQSYGDPYGTYIYKVPNDFVTGTLALELPFASTPFAPYVDNDMVFPFMNATGQNGDEIHLLIYGGLKNTGMRPWTLFDSSPIGPTSTQFTTYPFFGHLDDPLNPTVDLSFGMPPIINLPSAGRVTYTNNNLFNRYWRKYITQITDKDSRQVQGWFRIRPVDWYSLTFDKIYQFSGQNFRLLRVDDYNPENNDPVKLTFLRCIEPVAFSASTGSKGRGYDNTDGYGDRFPQDSIPKDKLNTLRPGDKPLKLKMVQGYGNSMLTDQGFIMGNNNAMGFGSGFILMGDGVTAQGERVISLLEDNETREGPGLFAQGTELQFAAPSSKLPLRYNSDTDTWAAAGFAETIKTTDEQATGDATLSNDTDLQFEMLANAKYQIQILVYYSTSATPQFKYALSGPSAPTLVNVRREHGNATVTDGFDTAYTASTAITGMNAGFVAMDILVHNGANAGTFAFQWAQNTSDVAVTAVLAGSYIRHTEIP